MNSGEIVTQWYDDYGESVFTYILMMVKDYQQAEDLTQETFIKAFRKHYTFSHKSSTKTWLFSIAQNTTKDFLRKRNPLRYYFSLSLSERDMSPLPLQMVEMNEQEEILFHALQNLKPNYRQVIIFRKLKEFSTRETAEILGWSESKVKSTLQRGIKDLKRNLIEGVIDYEATFR
ncbi:RNA polymerase sigma factor [Robertmurraya massiliosenegalensis]|uniref:RNA polymerase sigma factor n=1 Tax=Robertmurraya massiliosenegalensis TaxID=1287657 RepID=UPI00031A3FE6|nr:RNA polymerase sigma factor [Robertmurraya massiliosenegalensis]